MLFYIESRAGAIMGVFEGVTEEEAVAALNADANWVSTPDDWTIIEVVDVTHERGATLYTLRTGDVIVERCGHRRCYLSIDEARAAIAEED